MFTFFYLCSIVQIIFLSSYTNGSGYVQFSDPKTGRLSWIVEHGDTPWIGAYSFTPSKRVLNTLLLVVADSANSNHLAECISTSNGDQWKDFSWKLTNSALTCNVTGSVVSQIRFAQTQRNRTFSVRILADRGPNCFHEMIVNGERLEGCPPSLPINFFQQTDLTCECRNNSSSINLREKDLLTSHDKELQHPKTDKPVNLSSFRLSMSEMMSPTDEVEENAKHHFFGDDEGDGSTAEMNERANLKFFMPTAQTDQSNTERTAYNSVDAVIATSESPLVKEANTDATSVVFERPDANENAEKNWTAHPCTDIECLNNGTCVADEKSEALCVCSDRFHGKYCEIDYSEMVCEPMCMNMGLCVFVTDGISRCQCRPGTLGINCNVLDPCRSGVCDEYEASCLILEDNHEIAPPQIVDALYTCVCPDGTETSSMRCSELSVHNAHDGVDSVFHVTHPAFELSTVERARFAVDESPRPTSWLNISHIGADEDPVIDPLNENKNPADRTMSEEVITTIDPDAFPFHISDSSTILTFMSTEKTQQSLPVSTAPISNSSSSRDRLPISSSFSSSYEDSSDTSAEWERSTTTTNRVENLSVEAISSSSVFSVVITTASSDAEKFSWMGHSQIPETTPQSVFPIFAPREEFESEAMETGITEDVVKKPLMSQVQSVQAKNVSIVPIFELHSEHKNGEGKEANVPRMQSELHKTDTKKVQAAEIQLERIETEARELGISERIEGGIKRVQEPEMQPERAKTEPTEPDMDGMQPESVEAGALMIPKMKPEEAKSESTEFFAPTHHEMEVKESEHVMEETKRPSHTPHIPNSVMDIEQAIEFDNIRDMTTTSSTAFTTTPTLQAIFTNVDKESSTTISHHHIHNEIKFAEAFPTSPPDTIEGPTVLRNEISNAESTQSDTNNSTPFVFLSILALCVVMAFVMVAFVFRFVRRSRKLHGKYNPAKEESTLSSGHSLPMTTIMKEERLI